MNISLAVNCHVTPQGSWIAPQDYGIAGRSSVSKSSNIHSGELWGYRCVLHSGQPFFLYTVSTHAVVTCINLAFSKCKKSQFLFFKGGGIPTKRFVTIRKLCMEHYSEMCVEHSILIFL